MRKVLLAVLALMLAVPAMAQTVWVIPEFGVGDVQEKLQYHDPRAGTVSSGWRNDSHFAGLTLDLSGNNHKKGLQISGEFFNARNGQFFDWSGPGHRVFIDDPTRGRNLSIRGTGYIRPVRWLQIGAGLSVLRLTNLESGSAPITDHDGNEVGTTPISAYSALTYMGPQLSIGLATPSFRRITVSGSASWQPVSVRLSKYRTTVPEFGQTLTAKTWNISSGLSASASASYRVTGNLGLWAGARYWRVKTDDGADFMPHIPHFITIRTISAGLAVKL